VEWIEHRDSANPRAYGNALTYLAALRMNARNEGAEIVTNQGTTTSGSSRRPRVPGSVVEGLVKAIAHIN
jgi:hypothetical protein